MQQRYSLAPRGAQRHRLVIAGYCGLLLALLPGATRAQAPVATPLVPARNALTASRTADVRLSFSQNINSASAGNVRVYSAQAGGRKAGTYTTSGGQVTFNPTGDFKAGENVFATVPATVTSTTGVAAVKQVYQFTTAVTGAGHGNFQPGSDPSVGTRPSTMAVGDVDGDGDLDLAVANSGLVGTVSVRLNNGSGVFSGTQEVPMGPGGGSIYGTALGDVDGDGDLDLLAGDITADVVSIRFNNGSGTFTGSQNVPSGGNPFSIVLGDIDGDGDLDFLAPNNDGGQVSMHFNDGSGVFSGATQLDIASYLTNNLALGDVDGDGDLDLVAPTSNQNAGNPISVCFNNGAGSFGLPQALAMPTACQDVALGDADGDGDLDIFAVNYATVNEVYIRLNNGSGSFGGGQNVALSARPYGIALGDVDSDGDLDFVTNCFVSTTSQILNVLRNDGTGSFTGAQTLPTGTSTGQRPVLADVDGDFDLDVLAPISIGSTAGAVNVRLNQTFQLPTITSFVPASAAAGTIVTVNGTNLTVINSFTINGALVPLLSITGTSSGTSFSFALPAGANPTGTSTVTTPAGTVSSTGFTALFTVTGLVPGRNARTAPVANSAVGVTFTEPVTAATAPGLAVFSNQAGGRKAGTVTAAGSTASFAATASTAATNFRAGEVVSVSVPTTLRSAGNILASAQVYQFTTVVTGPAQGKFTLGSDPAVGANPYGVALGDVDGDGDLDLVTANLGVATVSVRLNDGAGNYAGTLEVPVATGTLGVALGDVDGDGDLDLLAANKTGNSVSVRLNNGSGTFTGTQNVAVGTEPNALTLGDVDADGDLDLLTANNLAGTVSVRLNNGASIFSGTQEVSVGTNPQGVLLGDVDNDGDLDLLATNNGSGTVSVRLNNGLGSFTGALNVAVGISPLGLALADADNDGDLDLLTANKGSNTVSVRLNNGLGSFSGSQEVAVGSQPTSVALGDLDSDGDLDLVATNNADGTVSVRYNSAGTFSGGQEVAVGSAPAHVALADLDGDGDLDFAATNTNANTVSVRLNPPAPSIASFAPASAAAGTSVVVTGNHLSNITAFTLNGVSVPLGSITPISATSFSFIVPAGATTNGTNTVSTADGSNSRTGFMVLLRVTALAPARNSLAPVTGSAVAVTFSEPITAASAVNLRVFSNQAGGRKAGTVTLGSNGLASFSATASTVVTDFKPGEVVSVSLPTTIRSAGNLLNAKQVHQFTTLVGGSGRGSFAASPDASVGTSPQGVATGDLDGDGDLDLVTANFGANTVSVRLNNGSGVFSGTQEVTVGTGPTVVMLADVDGDTDLDLLVLNTTAGSVSRCLNDGTGTFAAAATNVLGTTTAPSSLAVGDLDGDADLDLAIALRGTSQVAIRLNVNGGFTTATITLIGFSSPRSLALGDLDADGDLDLVVANNVASGTVAVRLNTGAAAFTNLANLTGFANPQSVALADVDGDGDLDLAVANTTAGTASLRLNGGTGTFGSATSIAVGSTPQSVVLADVDADGDFDLLTANNTATGTASLRLNDGTGAFGLGADLAVGANPTALVLSDLDNDGDLDLLTANNAATGTVSVRLNMPITVIISAIVPGAELPGTVVTLTGTGFAAGASVTFGGVASPAVVVSSGTSLTAVVPSGATVGANTVVVAAGASTSIGTPPAFTVLEVYNAGALNACVTAGPAAASVGDGAWHYLLSAAGQVVAAYNYTGPSLDDLSLDLVRADPAAPVRQDARSRYYLDRNFHLTASGGRFDGRTVGLRLYGLVSELARLQAADASVAYASLKATQYSGLNEDCDLSNNVASGERRVLAAPASTPGGGIPWFVAELGVADHFSEFYLTGSPTPLPVELVTFTAAANGAAVQLNWRTASERNSARFSVERSLDGRQFSKIGELAAQGTKTSPTDYTYVDIQPSTRNQIPQAPLYYRLLQVDLDGSASYSPVRTVVLKAQANLALFPNPATGATTLTGAAPGTLVEVFNALGQKVTAATADTTGAAALVLPHELASGMYVVRAGATALRLVVE